MNSQDEQYQGVCYWHNKDLCKDCRGTVTDWVEDCKRDEEMSEHAYVCVICDEGIANVTYNKTMACDKCYMELDFNAFMRIRERAD